MLQLFPPDVSLIDGIVGANYREWGGDPVTSGVLIAGDNAVATDAVATRLMGFDPAAPRGTVPFLVADNHLRMCAELGLGSLEPRDIALNGEMPAVQRSYSVVGAADPGHGAAAQAQRRAVSAYARGYFDHRDRYARTFGNELITLHKGRVLHHTPMRPDYLGGVMEALARQGLTHDDAFLKLVQEEEAELVEPYVVG